MKCPIDGDILKADKAEEHTGYGCISCKGSWLPKKYIDSIQYTKEFEPQVFFNTLTGAVNETTRSMCPVNCGELNSITEFKGVSYCPSCLGVWFESNALKSMLSCHRNKSEPATFVDSGSVAVGFFDIIGSIFK